MMICCSIIFLPSMSNTTYISFTDLCSLLRTFVNHFIVFCFMASLSFVLVWFLVLAAHEVMCLQSNTNGVDKVIEQEELFGLFEVMGSLLEDPTWAQMHPQPCTDTPWPGVQCEVGQDPPIFHVTKIHVGPDIVDPPCKPHARLSESLAKLPYLKSLSLFHCFTASPVTLLPSLFGSYSYLEHLALVSNPSLSSVIPPTLAEITTLKVLRLSQSNMHGEIPKEMGWLITLEELDLSYNNLSGYVPEEIGRLKNLTILDLSRNSFQGEIPSSLAQLRLLQKIDLGSNNLKGRVPPEIGKLKRLVLLDLSHNSLSGPIPETLSGLQQLEYLVIEDNPLNAEIPLSIGTLLKLKVISFSGCGLTGSIVTSFYYLKDLTSLSLDNNCLNGTVPPTLGTLPNLDELNLSQNQLSGELLLPEEFIHRLGRRLDVRGNNGLCTKHLEYKNKKSFTSTLQQIPFCLSRELPSGTKTWAKKHPDVFHKMKPTWYQQGNMTSNTSWVDLQFIFPFLFFLQLLLFAS